MSQSDHDSILYPSLPNTLMIEQCHDLERQTMEPVCPATSSIAPKTPNRDSPNIGRKRDHKPVFLRALPSPGHSLKMARIFQDAQATLRNDVHSTGPTARKSPARSRLPVPQRRRIVELPKGTTVCAKDASEKILAVGYSPSKLANETHNDHSMLYPKADLGEGLINASATDAFRETPTVEDMAMANATVETDFSERSPSDVDLTRKEKSADTDANLDLAGLLTRDVTDESDAHDFGEKVRSFSIWDDFEDTDLQLAHASVPLPTPMTTKKIFGPPTHGRINSVDKWLEDMLSASPRKKWRAPPLQGPTMDTQEGSSPSKESALRLSPIKFHAPEADSDLGESDKENQKPPGDGVDNLKDELSMSQYPLATIPATPQKLSRIPTLNERAMEGQLSPRKLPSRFVHPSTPRGYFLETPRRPQSTSKAGVSARRAEVQEDVKLSPDVEIYRKANRPKRSRCASFNDEDIIESPERKVLGESKLSRTLTRAMTFCEDAENFEFVGIETDIQ